MPLSQIKALIRDVPDFPKPGILFKDITPLLADASGFALAVGQLESLVLSHAPTGLVAIESRGFIFGAALAQRMRLPLLLVRKPGKLPARKVSLDYRLEYGSDRVEMHADAIVPGGSYAIVDDVIATGGTAEATARLIEMQGGRVACCAFLMELQFLNGRQRLSPHPTASVLQY